MIFRPEYLQESATLVREAALDLNKFLELDEKQKQHLGQLMLVHQALDRLRRALDAYDKAFPKVKENQ